MGPTVASGFRSLDSLTLKLIQGILDYGLMTRIAPEKRIALIEYLIHVPRLVLPKLCRGKGSASTMRSMLPNIQINQLGLLLSCDEFIYVFLGT